MAFQPIRDEKRGRVRFLFDEERGVIRHRSRGDRDQDYQVEVKEGRYELRPVETPAVGDSG